MDEFQKRLKQKRSNRWENFKKLDPDTKLFMLEEICANKAEDKPHLAVNLRN